MTAPIVYALGTCRIFIPLRQLAHEGKINPRFERTSWYTHSTRDILQKIRLVTGQQKLEEWQRPLLSPELEKNVPEAGSDIIFNLVDYTLVEISSVRSFTIDGFEVQQWVWTQMAKDAGIDPKHFAKETRLPPNERDLSFLPAQAPELLVRLAREGQLCQLTDEEIAVDLDHLSSLLAGKQIYVPPITVAQPDGVYIPDRLRLCGQLESLCERKGYDYFNPNPHIVSFGMDKALDNDNDHYTESFNAHLIKTFETMLCKPLKKP